MALYRCGTSGGEDKKEITQFFSYNFTQNYFNMKYDFTTDVTIESPEGYNITAIEMDYIDNNLSKETPLKLSSNGGTTYNISINDSYGLSKRPINPSNIITIKYDQDSSLDAQTGMDISFYLTYTPIWGGVLMNYGSI